MKKGFFSSTSAIYNVQMKTNKCEGFFFRILIFFPFLQFVSSHQPPLFPYTFELRTVSWIEFSPSENLPFRKAILHFIRETLNGIISLPFSWCILNFNLMNERTGVKTENINNLWAFYHRTCFKEVFRFQSFSDQSFIEPLNKTNVVNKYIYLSKRFLS